MTKANNKATKTVFIMVAAMILSKALGLVRSMLMASHYGIDSATDVFSAASKIPLVFFDLLFGAAILGCFIPIYNSFDRKNGDEEADGFAVLFLNFVFLLTSILSAVGIIFAPEIIRAVAPALDEGSYALATKLLRIMFPMVIFTGSAYTLVGVMQSKNRFILPSLISSISNLGVILYFIFLDRALGKNGLVGLAVAYLISWALQFFTLCIPLLRSGFRPRLSLRFSDPSLKKALKMTPQVMVGSWLAPVGVLIGTYFSSSLSKVGSVTVFDYSVNTYTIIAGILTYGVCNFVFPKFSRLCAEGDEEKLGRAVRGGIVSLFYTVIPVMLAALLLSGEGIAVLYMRGQFGAEDTVRTAQALRYLLVGMPAFCLFELLSRLMYAKKKAYAPMCSAAVGIVCNLVCTALLSSRNGAEVYAVVIGNAIGQIGAAACILVFTAIHTEKLLNRSFALSCIKIFLCSAISFFAMHFVYYLVGAEPSSASALRNIATAVCTLLAGASVYLILTRLCGEKFDLQGDEDQRG